MSARRAVLALAVAMTLVSVTGLAFAQAGGPFRNGPPSRPAEKAGADAKGTVTVDRVVEVKSKGAAKLGNSKSAAIFFWLFALLCVGGTVFVISRRNLIVATMGLVGTFFAIAAIYAMLFAHFMAAMQVLVYAGAIMVLFVFVVMILNREESDPWPDKGWGGKAVAGVALVYLVVRLSQVLWTTTEHASATIKPVVVAAARSGAPAKLADWGSTRAMGHTLFNEYLFPFEAVSLVLLVAVVGALAIARPRAREEAQP